MHFAVLPAFLVLACTTLSLTAPVSFEERVAPDLVGRFAGEDTLIFARQNNSSRFITMLDDLVHSKGGRLTVNQLPAANGVIQVQCIVNGRVRATAAAVTANSAREACAKQAIPSVQSQGV